MSAKDELSPRLDPALNQAPADPGRQQLLPANHSMLARGKPGQECVELLHSDSHSE